MSSFKKYTRNLTAGVEAVINVSPSNVVQVTAGSSIFKIRPDGQNPCDVENGIGVTYEKQFTTLRIVSPVDQTISVYIGAGEVKDNRLVGNVDISGGLKLVANGGVTTNNISIGVAATLIRPAISNRATCLIQNLSANNLYLKEDAIVDPFNSIKVVPGGSATLTWATTIYGYCDGAASDIRYSDETT